MVQELERQAQNPDSVLRREGTVASTIVPAEDGFQYSLGNNLQQQLPPAITPTRFGAFIIGSILVGGVAVALCKVLDKVRGGSGDDGQRDVSHLSVALFALAAFDVVTDVFQTAFTYEGALKMISAAMLLLSFVTNLSMMLRFLRAELRDNPEFREWFAENLKVVSPVLLVAMTKVEVLEVLQSRVVAKLSAPFSRHSMERVRVLGFVGLLLEDVPQFVFVFVHRATRNDGNFDVSSVMSFIGTMLSITYSLVTKLTSALVLESKSPSTSAPNLEMQEKTLRDEQPEKPSRRNTGDLEAQLEAMQAQNRQLLEQMKNTSGGNPAHDGGDPANDGGDLVITQNPLADK
mmetsp:Transcript_14336/g.47087  ORF Transcript_14336/g.47087 Transcript_14336/m.47087 type:complete len:347 (-) Transcript_14336:986-2026(-)